MDEIPVSPGSAAAGPPPGPMTPGQAAPAEVRPPAEPRPEPTPSPAPMAPEGRSGTGEHRDDAGTAATAATGANAPGETGDGARPASGRAGGRRRGGRGRGGQQAGAESAAAGSERVDDGGEADPSGAPAGDEQGPRQAGRPPRARAADDDRNPELPDRHIEGRPKSVEAAERALVPRKPRIGDTMPAPPPRPPVPAEPVGREDGEESPTKRRRRGGRGRGGAKREGGDARTETRPEGRQGQAAGQGQGHGGRGRSAPARPVEQVLYDDDPVELDERALRKRRGKERKGRPVGRYVMCVHVAPKATQIAVLEGRSLVEHYVSRPADDVAEIHGNVYLGKVQNVLPGMEAAFVDIGTPKNAVLYRGDVQYEKEDLEGPAQGPGGRPRIEQVLKARQTILCQVTKNPIAHKGARLTQEVSLPGRFVVLIPNSTTYGISKRLPDNERRRLRHILDQVKPPQHGVIVRTAAEGVTEEEIERDVRRLLDQWAAIEALAKRSTSPALLYREPDLALRVIREEFNDEYRSIIIDDRALFEEVRSYVASISPALADRVEYFDPSTEPLPLFERHHVHEQRLRALDRKVWLPSGGSLIIEHTEALTVIDVNTGKNVGTSSLEETVFRNNLEAAVEIARQLRLRDIGGIIVIDFVDMEIRENRDEVIRAFREALGRDKTRTQVFEISELGLVEMTRKRIGEGLIESVSCRCPNCEGRGLVLDDDLVGEDA